MSSFEARQEMREQLRSVTASLIAEFAGEVPAGAVIRCVARARHDLLSSGIHTGVPAAAEAIARLRLRDLVAPHL